MCDEQRATFAKVNIAEGGEVQTYFTMTIKRMHAVLTVLAIMITIVISLLTLRAAVYGAIKEFVNNQCSEQLDIFHQKVHPRLIEEMDELVNRRIIEHAIASEDTSRDRLDVLRQEINTLTHEVATLNERASRNQRLLEQLVDGGR